MTTTLRHRKTAQTKGDNTNTQHQGQGHPSSTEGHGGGSRGSSDHWGHEGHFVDNDDEGHRQGHGQGQGYLDGFLGLFGFRRKSLTSLSEMSRDLSRPCDPAALAVTRVAYGESRLLGVEFVYNCYILFKANKNRKQCFKPT